MYIYLIEETNSELGAVKIGMSADPLSRLQQLQTGNPRILRLVKQIQCQDKEEAQELESFIHEELDLNRYRGEWFGCIK